MFTQLSIILILVWLSLQNYGNVSKNSAYLPLEYRASFQAMGPSNLKHFLPSELKLALSLATLLHSSTNSLKCANSTRYPGPVLLWIWIRNRQGNLWHGNLFARFFCQRITDREKRKKSSVHECKLYNNFLASIPSQVVLITISQLLLII